jgi:hypothetical protein
MIRQKDELLDVVATEVLLDVIADQLKQVL